MYFNNCLISKALASINRKTLRREIPLFFRDLGVFALVFSLILLPVPITASAATTNKWGPHADITGKLGNERSLGDYDFFIPVLQGPESMLFLNLRFQHDDHEATEGNFGLGYRQMIDNSWIFGGYGFYDVRETQLDNKFRQWTFGLEALTERYDARFNVYLADEDKESVSSITGIEGFGYSDYNLIHRATPGYEQSMSGYDFELGGTLPILSYPEIRAYVGGFHFDTDELEQISGPRARLEVRFPDMFGWDGSLFEVGGEIRDDSVRNTDYYFTARLRIPFGSGSFAVPTSSLTALEKRMTERVQRDPDIIVGSNSDSGTGGVVETVVTYNSADILVHHYNSDSIYNSGTFEEPAMALDGLSGLAPTADIVLLQADSIFDGAGLVVQPSQRVLGEYDGMDYTVMTDQYGEILLPNATDGIARPRIINAPVGVTVTDGAEIAGLVIEGANVGLLLDTLTGPVDISNVNISGGNSGVQVVDSSSNVIMNSVTITDTSNDSLFVSGGTANVAILNSTITQSTVGKGLLMTVAGGHTGTIDLYNTSSMIAMAGSSDTGLAFDNADGSYYFSGAVDYQGSAGAVFINNDSTGQLNLYNATITPGGDGIYATDSSMDILVAGPSTVNMGTGSGSAVSLNNDNGTFVLSNTATITAIGGDGLQFSNADGNYEFAGKVVLNGEDAGVDILNSSGGDFIFYNTTINSPTGTAFNVDSSNAWIEFHAPSSITQNNDAATLVFSNDTTDADFYAGTTISATDGPGFQFNNTAGGKDFESVVTLDGVGTGITVNGQLGGSTINFYNAVTINSSGDGVNIQDNSGRVVFSDDAPLKITTTNGNGLYANGNVDGRIIVAGTGNTINATGGAALNITDTSTDLTFDTLSSTNSSGKGLSMIAVDGVGAGDNALIVSGDTTITGASNDGLYIDNLTADSKVLFNAVTIADSGRVGMALGTLENAATGNHAGSLIEFNGPVSIQNSAAFGTLIGANQGDVVLHDDLTVADSDSHGIYVSVAQGGDFTVEGSTEITNSAAQGVIVWENQIGTTVDFADLTVNTTGNEGILIANTGANSTATFTAGATTVYNAGTTGISILDTEGLVTFGTTEVYNSTTNGIEIDTVSGAVDFDETIVADTGANGVYVHNTTSAGSVTYNSLLIDRAGTNGIAMDYMGDAATDFFTVTHTTDIIDPAESGILITNSAGNATFTEQTTITNAGTTVGDGVNIDESTGNFIFNDLDVSSLNGSGVTAYNSGTLTITGSDNVIVANNGNAIGYKNTTVNTTFLNVTSNDSPDEGVYVEGGTGTLTVTDTATINNATLSGIEITASDVEVDITTVSVDTTGGHGILLENNTGSFIAGATTVIDADDDGIRMVGITNSATFGTTITTNAGSDGIVAMNTGIDGDVTFDSIDIHTTGDEGIILDTNAGDFTVTNETVVYNSAFIGIGIVDVDGATSFNGGLQVTTLDGEGIYASGGTGTITVVDDATTDNVVNATGGAALNLSNTTIDMAFDSLTSTDSDKAGIILNGLTPGSTLDIVTTTITNPAGEGIFINDAANTTLDFGDTTIDSPGYNSIKIQNSAGADISYKTTTLNGKGGIDAALGNQGMDLSFDSLAVTTSNGSGLVVYNAASVNVGSGTIVAEGGAALHIYNSAIDITLDAVSSNGAADNGLYLNKLEDGSSFTISGDGGTSTITNSGTSGIYISNTGSSYSAVAISITNMDIRNPGATGYGIELDNNAAKIVLDDVNIFTYDSGIAPILVTNQTGPAVVHVNSVTLGDSTIGLEVMSGNATTTITEDVTYTGLYNAITVDAGFIGNLDFTGDWVVDTGNGFDFGGSSGDFNFTSDSTVTMNSIGLDIDSSGGDFVFAGLVDVFDTTGDAVTITGTQSVRFDNLEISESGGNGVVATDAGTLTITNGTIYNTVGTGLDVTNTSLTVANMNIDTVKGVSGISAVYDSAGTYTVNLSGNTLDNITSEGVVLNAYNGATLNAIMTNNDITSTDHALDVSNTNPSDTSGDINFKESGNTYNAATVPAVIFNGGEVGAIIIEQVDNMTVLGDGGVVYNTVSFATTGGAISIGAMGNMVSGDGLVIKDSDGTLGLNTLDIYNDGGVGLDVTTSGADDLSISSTGGNLDTANGAAIILDGTASTGTLTSNLSLASVSSDLSAGSGIDLNDAAGVMNLGDATVTNSGADGIRIEALDATADVTFDSVTISDATDGGMYLTGNDGEINVTGLVDITNVGFDGIYLDANDGDATFADVSIDGTGNVGILIESASGTVKFGDTTVTDTVANGIEIFDLANAGSVTYNSVTVSNTGFSGIYMDTINGAVATNGPVDISTTGDDGVALFGGTGSVTFNDDLETTDTGWGGLYVSDFDGTMDLLGTTTLNNSGDAGASFLSSDADVLINELVIDGTGTNGGGDTYEEGLVILDNSGSFTVESGSISNTATDGIQIMDNAGDVTISNIIVDDNDVTPDTGIWINNTATPGAGSVSLYNATVTDFTYYGVHAVSTTVVADDLTVDNVGRTGVYSVGAPLTLTNSAILNTGRAGVHVKDADFTVMNTTIDTTANNGIFVDNTVAGTYDADIREVTIINVADGADGIGVLNANAGSTTNLYIYDSVSLDSGTTAGVDNDIELSQVSGTINLVCDPSKSATCASIADTTTITAATAQIILEEQNNYVPGGLAGEFLSTTDVIKYNAATLGF